MFEAMFEAIFEAMFEAMFPLDADIDPAISFILTGSSNFPHSVSHLPWAA
jgi:hypothetical protein